MDSQPRQIEVPAISMAKRCADGREPVPRGTAGQASGPPTRHGRAGVRAADEARPGRRPGRQPLGQPARTAAAVRVSLPTTER